MSFPKKIMLSTINYAIFFCNECKKKIKVAPGELVAKVECDCQTPKETPKSIKNKPGPKPKAEKPKEEEPKVEKSGSMFGSKDK